MFTMQSSKRERDKTTVEEVKVSPAKKKRIRDPLAVHKSEARYLPETLKPSWLLKHPYQRVLPAKSRSAAAKAKAKAAAAARAAWGK